MPQSALAGCGHSYGFISNGARHRTALAFWARRVRDNRGVADLISIVGGGTLPSPVGQLSASYPFVRLDFDTRGVTVRLHRWRWSARFALGVSNHSLVWSHPWEKIERALVAPRKVVLYPRVGQGVRFVTPRKQRLDSLRTALARHEIAVERIPRWSLAGWML